MFESTLQLLFSETNTQKNVIKIENNSTTTSLVCFACVRNIGPFENSSPVAVLSVLVLLLCRHMVIALTRFSTQRIHYFVMYTSLGVIFLLCSASIKSIVICYCCYRCFIYYHRSNIRWSARIMRIREPEPRAEAQTEAHAKETQNQHDEIKQQIK